MSTMTPTARALRFLRANGYEAEVVEKRLPRCFITRDAFGIIDIIGLRPGELSGFQVSDGSHHANRKQKAIECRGLAAWLAAGGRFFLLTFTKSGARGKRKTWVPRQEELTLADLPPQGAPAGSARAAEVGRAAASDMDAAGAIVGDPGGTRDDD